jgi:hypothetical protein
LFRDAASHCGKPVWNIRGMLIQRERLPEGYHLPEINSMLCSLRWHISNLENGNSLHNN